MWVRSRQPQPPIPHTHGAWRDSRPTSCDPLTSVLLGRPAHSPSPADPSLFAGKPSARQAPTGLVCRLEARAAVPTHLVAVSAEEERRAAAGSASAAYDDWRRRARELSQVSLLLLSYKFLIPCACIYFIYISITFIYISVTTAVTVTT